MGLEKYNKEQDNNNKKRIFIYIIIIIIIILALLTSCSCTGKFIGKIGDIFKNEGDYNIDGNTNDLEVIRNRDLRFDLDHLTIKVSDKNGKISFSYDNIKPEKFVCKTSDASIAVCYVEDGYVVVVPKKPGKVTVTLETETNGKKYEATTEITIEDSEKYISLSSKRGTINLSDSNTKTIAYTLVGIKGNVKVESSDSSIANATAKNGKLIVTGYKLGKSTITLSVTVDDKTYTAQYVVTVINQITVKDSNNKLANLTTNKGTLTPKFNENTKDYKIDVESDVDKITLLATPKSSKAQVTYIYNGKSTTNFEDMPIKPGNNNVIIKVTAEDGSTNVYTVTIHKKDSSSETKDNNSKLSNILTSVGTLNPSFSSNVKDYNIEVSSNITNIKITGIPESSKATVKYVFENQEFKDPKDIALKSGKNIVNIVVTAEDNSTTTYTVTINKLKDNDSSLSNLIINPGTLVPSFNPTKTHYSVTVNESVDKVTIVGTSSSSKASVKYMYNGKEYTSFNDIPINKGNNVVYVEVTSEDGTTTTYTIEIHKYYLDSEKSFEISYDSEENTKDIILYTNIFENNIEAKYNKDTKELKICSSLDSTTCVTLATESNLIENISYVGEKNHPKSLAIKIKVNGIGDATLHVKGTVANEVIDSYDISLKILQKYIITLDANGGIFNELSTKYVFKIGAGEEVNLSNLDRPYYVLEDNECLYYEFKGYSLNPDSEELYSLDNVIKYEDLSGDLTLYAVYNKTEEKELTTESKLLWVADIPLFKDEKYFEEHGIEKIIFPGATGKYTLNLKNESSNRIEFTGITLKEDTICFEDGCINIGYKIKDDNTYYFGSSSNYEILNQTALTKDWANNHNETKRDFTNKLVLEPGEEVALTIHFEWVEVNDNLDTKVGNHAAKKTTDSTINDLYTLYMGLHFDVIREDCKVSS